MAEVPREFYERFSSVCDDKNCSPLLLDQDIDENILNPSFSHFMYRQLVRMLIVKRRMEKRLRKKVSDASVSRVYQASLSDTHYLSYFLKYVAPVFCDEEKERKFIFFPKDDQDWVDGVFDKVVRIASIDKATILSRIAEKDKDLARRLEEEGFVAHYIPMEELVLCGSSSGFSDSFHSDYY